MSEENRSIIAPPWIDSAFTQKALQNAGEEGLQVESITCGVATAPGDNYTSDIYRVNALMKDGTERSLLIKTVLDGEEMETWARETRCFDRESTMLVEIIPQIEALLDGIAPGQCNHLAARCPLYGDSPKVFIVMEDLRPQGFRMAVRKRGLGLRHCLISIRTLARYHAAGHLLLKRDPSLTRLDSAYNYQPDNINVFIEGGIMAAAQVCKTWPGFEECARRLEKFKNVAMKTFRVLNDPKPESFNVIVHGDFWTNNIMFRYDEDGNPTEIRIVDYQFSHVASPVLDLLYFLSTSLNEDVCSNHQDLLIREYYFALQEAMTLLGMEAPSFETLLADIDAHGPHSILGTVTVNPIVKATQAPDLERIMSGDLSSLIQLYNSPEVKKYMQRVLPKLKCKNWLPA